MFQSFLQGYEEFQRKYVQESPSFMQGLLDQGQQPHTVIVACCDSRVDPALILQCHPGEIFVVRNVANIVPPYEKDHTHHGTSAALEFAVKALGVRHIIVLGHSGCGGVQLRFKIHSDKTSCGCMHHDHLTIAYENVERQEEKEADDFLSSWVSIIQVPDGCQNPDDLAKTSLHQSYANAMTFPWIAEKCALGSLHVHRWFFDIGKGAMHAYDAEKSRYNLLDYDYMRRFC